MTGDPILFETAPDAPAEDPARLDTVAFVGFLAQREPPAPGAALLGRLARRGHLPGAAGPVSLYDCPVPVASLADYEALFDGAARLDAPAEVRGHALPAALDPAALAQPLLVALDGALAEIDLAAAPPHPAGVAAALAAAVPGLEVRLQPAESAPGGAAAGDRWRLSLALPAARGPGTLAVLPHAGLGFPHGARARARRVATVMDAAIRQFFAMGGRSALIVSLGPPLPLLADRAARAAALGRLMGVGPLPAAELPLRLAEPLPPPQAPAARRMGIAHLAAEPGPAWLVLPDLPDLTAADRAPPPAPAPAPPAGPVAFAACLPQPAPAPAAAVADLTLPVADAEGLALWRAAIDRTLALIRDQRRDLHLIAALPRAEDAALRDAILPRSAFLILAAPWLRTPFSDGLPQRALPACAVLAGQIAATAAGPAPFASAAARPLRGVLDLAEPGPAEAGSAAAAAAAALPVSWLRRGPLGPELTREITTSADPGWRPAVAGRVMARLLRAAAAMGEEIVFEPIDARLMRRVAVGFEAILGAVAAAGGLRAGPGGGAGYSVACDRRTTRPEDIDRGVLRAEVAFRPAAPIEAIRVVLALGGGGATGAEARA